ncbi:pilin [Patescibacteria group bacterium]|nr:pilin [Patescibacteria group bacterium]
MKKLIYLLVVVATFMALPIPAYAVSSEITNYTSETMNIITIISTAAAVFFLIKGGYLYITSTGKPDNLEQAKKTIKNALIGLVLVLAAGIIVSFFKGALTSSSTGTNSTTISMPQVTSVKPSDGLTQVLIDAVSSFMQNIVESSVKPIVDGVISFLTTTPTLLNNSVIMNFWLVMLGITDSLFVVIVALLGFHFMSASTFGFEETELRQLLPRIGLAFLGANISLFLANYIIITCNALTNAVINSTGGLSHAWVTNAITIQNIGSNNVPIITLIFLVIFLIVSIVLLLLYISRLIMISLGAVLSPFIFLLWLLPKFSDFAEIAVKTYVVTVFIVFVHVVIIQLAASFLTLPENSNNSLISIAVAIGLFITLLKTPSLMMNMVLYTSRNGTFKKLGGQIINVISTDNTSSATRAADKAVKTPRKVVAA